MNERKPDEEKIADQEREDRDDLNDDASPSKEEKKKVDEEKGHGEDLDDNASPSTFTPIWPC